MRAIRGIVSKVVIALLATVGIANVSAQKKVGVLWVGKSGMTKRVIKGFLPQMKAKAPDIALEFKPELKTMEEAAAIYADWQKSKDGIVFLRSTGAKYVGKNPPSIPTFVGGCSNPVLLGALKNMEKPDGKVTGVTYYLNAKEKVAQFKKLMPELKSVGLLVKEGHPSAPIDQRETKAACKALGLTYQEIPANTELDVLKAVKKLSGEVDLIILGSQAEISAHATKAATIAGKTPMASYITKAIKGTGAVCGLAPDDVKLGALLADCVVEVVKEGKAVSEVGIKTDPNPQFILNLTMVKKLGLTVSPELLKAAKKVQ